MLGNIVGQWPIPEIADQMVLEEIYFGALWSRHEDGTFESEPDAQEKGHEEFIEIDLND